MDIIRLEGMLPRVFVSEDIPSSDIWSGVTTLLRGEMYLVEATSGAGKSSLCAYLYGLRDDYEGKLCFNKNDVRKFSIDEWQEIRRTHIAFLPQELSLFPELSALQNIELKNSLTNHVAQAQIEEWLHVLGIDSRKNSPVGRMSVGQQQRVGIIRALCQPFDFIILDEPVSHLDEGNNLRAAEMIVSEARRQDAGIVVTSVGNRLLIDHTRTLKL
ncbi:MAG: ATP-binding cassette domain-containing protein [Bacteroides sp.]|nr:ATP-binding cassette domain-containing protein [Bacteroides sp.]